MKHLSLSTDRRRLTLVIPDVTPLRAAAKAVRGYVFEGRNDGHAVFSFPAEPDVTVDVLAAFEPTVSPSSREAVDRLAGKAAALEAAVEAKGSTQLGVDLGLVTEPMSHQVAAASFAWARFAAGARGTALLMEQGTGKSLVAVGLANALRGAGRIDWGMVIAPNGLKGTWAAEDGEILTHTHPELRPRTFVPRGTRAQQVERAGDFLDGSSSDFPWVIINYEHFQLNPRRKRDHRDLVEAWSRLACSRPGVLVLDESTLIKNHSAKRTAVIRELAAHFPYAMILTGTPVTASPLDVYAQFDVMEPGCLGFQSYLAFDRAYAVRQRRQRRDGRGYQDLVGYQDLEDLEQRVARVSFRARAVDCLDLPDRVIKNIPVALSPEQARITKQLTDEMMAELGDGFVDGRNILTRYLRLGQVAGGFVGALGADGRPEERTRALKPNAKLDVLVEQLEILLEDPEQKAVVFAQYRAEVEAITQVCRDKGWQPSVFIGGQGDDVREENRRAFKTDPAARVFVLQYQTGSKGLTLTEARTTFFYSFSFSLEDFEQARARIYRKGQTKNVTEVYLVAQTEGRRGAKRTLDHVILEALRDKRNLADAVTGDARRILESIR